MERYDQSELVSVGKLCKLLLLAWVKYLVVTFKGSYILQEKLAYVRFEVFTAVTMKNGVFWDVMPCGSCKNQEPHGVTSQKTPFFKVSLHPSWNIFKLKLQFQWLCAIQSGLYIKIKRIFAFKMLTLFAADSIFCLRIIYIYLRISNKHKSLHWW
jgi:hypothetical protein